MSRKKLVTLGCIGVMLATVLLPAKVSAQNVRIYGTGESSIVTPQSTQYRWYYKIENGKKYRRLWDATNEKWLTDWILCP